MRRLIWPVVVGALAFACSSDEGDAGGEGQGGSAGTSAGMTSAGTSNQEAGQGQGASSSSGGESSGGSQAEAGSSSKAGSGGSKAGSGNGGMGGALMCPPCVPPPDPSCVGSGPCGCGPYTCPSGGASGDGEECGPVSCELPLVCCNPVMGLCALPDQVCLQ